MDQPEPEKEKLDMEGKPFSELPPAPPAAEKAAAAAPKIPPVESRARRFLRIAIRWVVGFLIVFLLGAVAMEFVFYRPLSIQLQQVKLERDQAQQSVKSLQGQIDSMAPLSTQNAGLQNDLSKSQLHVTLLSAEANVNAAQIALFNNKPADARLVLNKTATTLKTLQQMLPSDQQKVATDMQSRLALALGELDSNKFAAQSDLNVLATSLLQLENTFFANP